MKWMRRFGAMDKLFSIRITTAIIAVVIVFVIGGVAGFYIAKPTDSSHPSGTKAINSDIGVRITKDNCEKLSFCLENENDSIVLAAMDASQIKGANAVEAARDCAVEKLDSFWTLKLQEGNSFTNATIGEADEAGRSISFWSGNRSRPVYQNKTHVYYYRLTEKNERYIKTDKGKVSVSGCNHKFRADHIVYVGGSAGDIIIGIAEQEEFDKETPCNCQ